MRQILFELLRHGPANNQLLSPLTQYLSLCENHAAVTVRVPFEHNQFLHRHRALSYQLGEEARRFQVRDTALVLSEVLGQVPGLIAELNRDPPGERSARVAREREPQQLTHLRLVISASELALLPFELALSPNGFPGSGQYLLLQSQEPICITREVRRVPEEYFYWPKRPRVLFAAAAPAAVGQVPFQQHLDMLRSILEPWVAYADTDEERRANLDALLVVIPEATAPVIERACAEHEFSHVHVLAHGMEYRDGFDTRFGLALHDPNNPGKADVVSGERLATILRAVRARGNAELARPIAVTLASCDSGNVGSVAGTGASVAHALHAAGISMVVASQFPISVDASKVFVDVLYNALLWGEDPRVALNDLRRRLHSRFPDTHDWASVTAYVSLPPEFERRLGDIQVSETMRSIDVAMNHADRTTAMFMKRRRGTGSGTAAGSGSGTGGGTGTGTGSGSGTEGGAPPADEDARRSLLEKARARIEAGRARLEQLLGRQRDRIQRARLSGLLASTEKRCAEVYFSFSRVVTKAPQHEFTQEGYRLLENARRHYWDAFLLNRAGSWAVVQYLSLDLLLRNWKSPVPDAKAEPHDDYNNPEALWNLAHVLSINDVRSKDEETVHWALGNLIELNVLALLIPGVPPPIAPDGFVERAVQRAKDLVDRAGADSFAVYSTRRQILRYDDWYAELADVDLLLPAIERVLDVLPASRRGGRE